MPAVHYARIQSRPGKPSRDVPLCAGAVPDLTTTWSWRDVTCRRCLRQAPAWAWAPEEQDSEAEQRGDHEYDLHRDGV